LSAVVNNVKMIELARQVTAISHEGLKSRAYAGAGGLVPDETHFLNSIHDILEREKSPADDLLDHFHGPWGSDLKKVYEEFSY